MIDLNEMLAPDGIVASSLDDLISQMKRIADTTEQLTTAVIIHNELTRTTNQRLGWIEEALLGKIKEPKAVDHGKKQQSNTGS